MSFSTLEYTFGELKLSILVKKDKTDAVKNEFTSDIVKNKIIKEIYRTKNLIQPQTAKINGEIIKYHPCTMPSLPTNETGGEKDWNYIEFQGVCKCAFKLQAINIHYQTVSKKEQYEENSECDCC